MQTVILVGGKGERLASKTKTTPKPLLELNDYPVLCHIMKLFADHGIEDFILPLGYKSEEFKNLFRGTNKHSKGVNYHAEDTRSLPENWTVKLIETGLNTSKRDRLQQVKSSLDNSPFLLTYGDCLADLNVTDLLTFHREHNQSVTITAVHPKRRYGHLDLNGDRVQSFKQNPKLEDTWINGGFMVLEPEFWDVLDQVSEFEEGALEWLGEKNAIRAYRHEGFWYGMDTLKDYHYLRELTERENLPWGSTE